MQGRTEVRDFTADEAVLFGQTLEDSGDTDSAERLYRSVLVIMPEHFQAMFRLGTVLADKKSYYEALYRLDRAVKINRKSELALSNRGMVLSVLGHHEEAIADFERALCIDPDNYVTLSNYGNTLEHVGRYQDALRALDKSISIFNDAEVAHQNRGVVLFRLGRIDDAIASSTEAMRIKPDYHEAQYNRGLARLYNGDLRGGFEDCEAALLTPHVRKPLFGPFKKPQWDGKSFAGKTLLVTGEQGLGDTIHFMRYLPYAQALGGKIIVAVHELARALYKPPGDIRILKHGETSPPFDLHCPLMSLPHRLGMYDDTPVLPESWYSHGKTDAEAWRQHLATDKLKVGLCWSGNGGHKHDADRSIPLEKFSKLVTTEGVAFYGLQKDVRPEDLKTLANMPQVIPLGQDFVSFRDTAAAISCLDLVISVDTSVAHLAASLRKPTWILLPAFGTDWRWQKDRLDSPWYPTASLWRQPARGDWGALLNKVQKELNTLVAVRQPAQVA